MNEKCKNGEVVLDCGQNANQNTEVKTAQAQGHRKLCFKGRDLLLNCGICRDELVNASGKD